MTGKPLPRVTTDQCTVTLTLLCATIHMCMYVLQAIFSNTNNSKPWLELKSSLGIGVLEYLVGGLGVPLASCDWTLGPHVVMPFLEG